MQLLFYVWYNCQKGGWLMAINLIELKRKLAEHKVYNAWQYVESLQETMRYMNISFEMLKCVYEHRVITLKSMEQEMLHKAINTGQAAYGETEKNCTNLNIGGFVIDDIVFLKKTTMEFFHYGRISMDVLFQILNAALLGDEAYQVDDKGLLKKLLTKLKSKTEFSNLLKLTDNNKENDNYKYLTAFDNYVKHIKIIPITVKNSFLLGNEAIFMLDNFCYCGIDYPSENAINKIKKLNDYVLNTVEYILEEILLQIPNCLDNRHRIQTIQFKQIFKNHEKGSTLEYMTFFIEVENDISELPSEIKVFPLIIKPNDDIYCFDFRFDKIFIKKTGGDESDIVGYAKLKNGINSNEFYRIFEVKSCDIVEYFKYISSFRDTYSNISFNIYAMDGEMIFLKD